MFVFVFVLFEKNTENEVCVRERHFHWWARDREVAREPESRCRALEMTIFLLFVPFWFLTDPELKGRWTEPPAAKRRLFGELE